MHRDSVESSNVAAVGYDPVSRMLEVEFKNGGVYQYADVSREDADGLVGAESVGRFLNQMIKPTYAATKAGG